MLKVKEITEEDPNAEEVIPIPVQIFLWRQTTPFVRPRLGKVHDAACQFCQRAPGHHSFEKVLVQNLRFGLSISLTEAIESIPRWRLIQAAFPHVMHSLAALLHNRIKDNMQTLATIETKLLYTLHWIILDASDECAEADYENGVFYSNPFHYLFTIPAMTLFVFLFAPLSHHLKESDFSNNFRLENGLKMWQAMWEFRHPDAPCFTTHVKPKPKPLGGKLSKEEANNMNGANSPPSQNISMTQSEMTSKQASTEEEPWLSSPKDTIFPETIPEESSSTEEEHVFIYRLPSEQNFGGAIKEYAVYTANPEIFQPRKTDASKQPLPGIKPLPQITKMSSSDKESLSDSGGGGPGPKGTPTTEKVPFAKQGHVSAATFLDVATLRCLFTSQWQEEGVYWALHYLYNRLRDICDDMSKQTQPRKRSNSLPIPKIEVSLYQSPDMKERESLKNFIEIPEVKDMSPITEMPFPSPPKVEEENLMSRRSSEKIKRKMKMADLKAFVETKLLSKSEKTLEKIGHDDKFSFHTAVRMISEYHRSLDNTDDRPNSALASNFPPLAPRLTGDLFHCNLIKGKSMPSLRYIGEVKTERTQGPSNTMPVNFHKKKNPIITVTEHTPAPSPDYLSKTRQGSLESQIDSVSMQGSQHIPTPERKPSLTRSQTDSNITYVVEEIQEAPGSIHYITKDGDIDFQVVLKAVHSVSTMDSFYITLRVMEVMLNLVDTLMEIGVHKNWQNNNIEETQPGGVDPMAEFNKDKESKERDSGIPCAQSQDSTNIDGDAKDKSKEEENLDCPYYMIMQIILRLLRQLGCSHGCTSALRGPQAECLRVQARNSLRQLRTASVTKFTVRLKEMTKYAPIREVLDNLHAAVGFCAEPATLVSPMNQQKRGCTKSPDISNLQTGYATNFGAGQGPNANRAIETFIVETTFRVLVTRFALMHKELKMLDNSALYTEVRLLLSYVREAHGGEFRIVAFSALLDTAERPDSQQKDSNMQTTRVIRHIPRASEEERGSDTGADSGCAPDERSHKKFNFKKRSTSSTGPHSLLETEGGEESASQSPLSVRTRRYQLTPRQSERTIPSASSTDITPHHKIHSKSMHSKFHISGIVNWFRQKPQQSQSLIRNGGGSGESLPISGSMISLARPPHLPPPHTSRPVHVKRRVGYTLNRARKQVEDRLNRFGLRKMRKKRDGSIEDTSGGYMSRRGSAEGGSGGGESEVVILKRRRLVAAAPLYAGLARFNFLLDATQPGGTPDALFMVALLDLPHTVVVGRAAILLECAHLVHNCNKGQWPYWLKSNASKNAVSLSPQVRRQRLAGKLFYQWAEAIGNRLEEMLIEDKKHIDTVVNLVNDPDGQRELLQQDEEEDFLDEASIRVPGKPTGAECPRALRIIACVLLFEITAFLREGYQNLPKIGRSSLKERGPWDKVYREANRRWSMALSSMGHSQASAQSLQSIAGVETERKISFVLHEPENVSGGSNVTLADAIPPALDDKKGRLGSRGKGGMHRRNTQQTHSAYGSFKRRSIKLRQKDNREVEEFVTRRSDSIQSRRKVSSLSDRSDTSEVYPGTGGTVIMSNEVDSGGEESPGVLSDDHDHPPDSPDSNSTDPPDTNKGFPWLKVMVKFLNSFNYVCCHQNFCHPYCFRRNMRASVRLMKSVQKIYGEKFGPEINIASSEEGSGSARRGRRTRKPSEHSADRIERSVIESAGLAYRAAGGEQTAAVLDPAANSRPAAMPYPPPDTPAILKYLKGQVRDAYHTPLATLIKGATTMSEEMFAECAPVAWQLLLESDRELSSCAAALFILVAVKAPHTATEIMHNDLKHAEPTTRINAILRFQVMWKLRYQVWPRMEEGASVTFKVPPPGIEFTLPSPKIGIESLAVVDPPWSPQVKDKDMEMTLNQERHRSLVTATKTRKKQQTEAIKRALQQRNDKKRAERESFLITTIPITRQAAREPALDHAADDHVEPPADEELVEGVRGSHHTQVASALFPSTLCSAVAEIVSLLDDAAVSRDGCSVYEVAYQVIWCCLVEDSALFLRHVLERLTRDHQDEMFKLLRHLIRFIPRLPQQAAFALYNYIIGYVMFYVRSPHEEGQRLVGAALSILWMVVHSVHGIMFKDLKQILRKEQCDASILLTANVPAAKKIIVHGPSDNEGSIPSQFPVQEDTVFSQILKESLDFFGIPEKLHREHFLVDFKTRQIHNPQSYVRDHYFFKRSQYPQLGLVHMEPDDAFLKLQEQELLQKFVEIGKVLLTWAILKNVDMVVQRVVFLHDELMKLPSFPRKALEADLVLYSRGPLGSTLLGLDVLHKFMWVRLIARMFEAMAGNFTSSRDIHLFLNVLNGALMLHSEDSLILRYVIATYVNAAFNFKSIFSTNGYLLIMPTLLQIYSNFQTNKLVTTTIEYAVKQFYLLNRKPFILQMFGSVSAILDTDEESTYGDASKVQSSCLFNLLLSLETPSPDPLHIAELIKEEKPLKPIDFCYRDEDEMVNVLDCISLCVMVVSYSAESMRGYQMLIILEAILPCYVKQIQLPTYNREGKTEKEIIQQLAIAIKTLVNNCEGLSKSYNGPYRTSPEHKGSSQRTGPRTAAATIIAFEESHSKYDNSKMPGIPEYTGAEDSELVRAEYRRPRDVLLSLVGEFIGRATSRLLELNGSKGSGGSEGKPVELLDSKSHARLADIAHSLLKVSPYDPESMGCRGLQRYMTQVLPAADWADDALRPALIMILRRLDKVFLKIAKKPSIRRNTDWDSAAVLLKGVYETMIRCHYIMHWQQVKTLLNTVQALIVSDNNCGENLSSATAALMSQPPPPHFCSTVVRLIALQVINTGDSYSLEQMCGGSAIFQSAEKTENMLMNLFMPLCLRVGSGRKDVPPLRQSDVSYLVSVVLNALCPPAPANQLAQVNAKLNASDARANSLTFTGSRDTRNTTRLSNQLYRIAFLALKVMCACFTSELCTEWGRIARTMRDLGRRNEAAHHLWDFLEHVVTYRTPLYILLQPFIVHKLSQPPIGDNERHMQFIVRERVRGLKLPAARARGALLAELARELRNMRDTHDQYKFEQIAENLGQSGAKRASEVFPRSTTVADKHQQHRPSLISMLVGRGGAGGLPRTPDHPSAPLSAQRESVSSSSTTSQHMPTFEVVMNSGRFNDNSNNNNSSGNSNIGSMNFGSGDTKPTVSTPSYTSTQTKLRFVPSVELKFTTGETSTSPLSPMSPGEASCGESVMGGRERDLDRPESPDASAGERPRLQRAHGPSKKTFKFRRSRHTKPEPSHVRLESDDGSSPGPETTPLRRAWSQPPFLQPAYINTDTSYDSEISQTSSTSGYRASTQNSQRSLPEIPHPVGRHDSGDTASEIYATVNLDEGNKIEAAPSTSRDRPYEHAYAKLQNESHVLLEVTADEASERDIPIDEREVAQNPAESVVISASVAISGQLPSSQELPYITPPSPRPNTDNIVHFSGDSTDSAKGYTSISVREPLSNIRAQSTKQPLQPHYATVSDDSDETYAAIEEASVGEGSDTYAQIATEPRRRDPTPDLVQIDPAHASRRSAPPEIGASTSQATHSRQASSSSCSNSTGALGSPKPEKRQANSPLPPPPLAGTHGASQANIHATSHTSSHNSSYVPSHASSHGTSHASSHATSHASSHATSHATTHATVHAVLRQPAIEQAQRHQRMSSTGDLPFNHDKLRRSLNEKHQRNNSCVSSSDFYGCNYPVEKHRFSSGDLIRPLVARELNIDIDQRDGQTDNLYNSIDGPNYSDYSSADANTSLNSDHRVTESPSRNVEEMYAKVMKKAKGRTEESIRRSKDFAGGEGEPRASKFRGDDPGYETIDRKKSINHGYETITHKDRKSSQNQDPGYETVRELNSASGNTNFTNNNLLKLNHLVADSGPNSIVSSDPGYEHISKSDNNASDSDPNYEVLRNQPSTPPYATIAPNYKVQPTYSTVNKRPNKYNNWTANNNDEPTLEPNYESMPHEPLYNTGSESDPNYESVRPKDPNYDSVSAQDPNYESLRCKDPKYESVRSKDPKYDSVRSKKDPNYESVKYFDVSKKEPPYEKVNNEVTAGSSVERSDSSAGYEKINVPNSGEPKSSINNGGDATVSDYFQV